MQKLWLLRPVVTLFTRLLALLVVLGVVFTTPVSLAASLVEHAECHGCEHSSGETEEHSEGNCGSDHDCPCACHVQASVAVVVAPSPVSGPKVLVVDWLTARDAIPVEGLPPGIDHPPQNA